MELCLSKNVSWKNLEPGIVLLDLKSGVYFTLNETATVIMRGILDGKSEEDIVSAIVDDYDCEREQATSDFREQVAFLISEGLLEEV